MNFLALATLCFLIGILILWFVGMVLVHARERRQAEFLERVQLRRSVLYAEKKDPTQSTEN